MSRKYELVYVVSPDATDEQVAELHTQVESIVQRMDGQIEKTDNWGRRKLAYEIGRHKEGTYVLEVINGAGELMKEIDRRLKVTDLVIRHLVVRVDEEQGVVDRTRGAPHRDVAPPRVARGLPPDRQPGEGQRGEPDDDRDDRFDMGGRRCDERQEELRRRRRPRTRRRRGAAAGQGRPARRRCSGAARSASSARTRSTTSTTRT